MNKTVIHTARYNLPISSPVFSNADFSRMMKVHSVMVTINTVQWYKKKDNLSMEIIIVTQSMVVNSPFLNVI
jgi:hypothetical protein